MSSDTETEFFTAREIVKQSQPSELADAPRPFSTAEISEYWTYTLIGLMGSPNSYKEAWGDTSVFPKKQLIPYQLCSIFKTGPYDVGKHLAHCGISDEEMVNNYKWSYKQLGIYLEQSKSSLTLLKHEDWKELKYQLCRNRQMHKLGYIPSPITEGLVHISAYMSKSILLYELIRYQMSSCD